MKSTSLLAKDDIDALNNDLSGMSRLHVPMHKVTASRYGSTGTLSTATYIQSSSGESSPTSGSLQSEDHNNNNSNYIQSLNLDLAAIDSASEHCVLISGESLSSDSSDDDSNEFLQRHRRVSRLSRFKRRASSTALYIENSFLTLSNFKVALSFVLWWLCYMVSSVLRLLVAPIRYYRALH